MTPAAQTEKLFHDLIDLLEELTSALADRDDEREPDDAELDADDAIAAAVEEAEDRGIDGEAAERFLKAALAAARTSAAS